MLETPVGTTAKEIPSASQIVSLCAFCAATVLLIPLERFVAGSALWVLALVFVIRSGVPRFRRNMGLLLALIGILALSPINTDRSTGHFIALAIPFAIVVFGPYLYMRRYAPGEMDWRFWPRAVSRRDIIYTAISLPLSWGIIWLYFFYLTPDLALNWPMPAAWDENEVRRLVIGINAVGIWDEFFFINTVYVLLRGVLPARVANPIQAVVYASVLNDMAFTGWGPLIVYLFALTQGVMYEKSGVLLYVLIVHLIVDVFLVLAILHFYYPSQPLLFF